MDCDDGALLEHTEELVRELGPGEGDQEDWLIKKAMNIDEAMNGQEEEEDDDEVSSSEDEEEEDMEQWWSRIFRL